MYRIAIIGNRGANIGAWMAGDLALAGFEVRFFLWEDQLDCFNAFKSAGGVFMNAPASETMSGRTGLGALKCITGDLTETVSGADLVVMDVAAAELEERARRIVPHLENDQVLYINSHAHWSGMRLAPLLQSHDKAGVIVMEGTVPTISAKRDAHNITPIYMRRGIPVSAFPANRSQEGFERLKAIVPSADIRQDSIETNFENMDMLVHPAMGLLNVGYFDRRDSADEPSDFYGIGNTVGTGRLAEAMDAERYPVCAKYGVRYRPVLEHIRNLYGCRGDSVREAVRNSPLYQGLKPIAPGVWRSWMKNDITLAQVPFVQLAELAGERVPLNRGFVEIADVLLGTDSWTDGLNLDRLGVKYMTFEQVRKYAETGESRL